MALLAGLGFHILIGLAVLTLGWKRISRRIRTAPFHLPPELVPLVLLGAALFWPVIAGRWIARWLAPPTVREVEHLVATNRRCPSCGGTYHVRKADMDLAAASEDGRLAARCDGCGSIADAERMRFRESEEP
jgi:hypothetical protein